MLAYFKRSLGLMLAVLMIAVYSPVVFAAGTTTLYMSGTSIGVGDTLTVDVSATEQSKLTIKYTSAILDFSSCSDANYTTDGNAIVVDAKDVTLKFKGASAGKANLIVTSDTQTGSSAAITVSDNGTTPTGSEADEAGTDAAAEYEEAAAAEIQEAYNEEMGDQTDGAAAVTMTAGAETYSADTGTGDYLINGIPHVLSERFTDEEIPAGFSRVPVTIHDKSLNEISNGSMMLVYLKPEANTSGSGIFYIYDEAADTVTTLHMVGTPSDYVMLMTPGELWNRNLTQTSVTMGDGTEVSAYQVGGVTSEFYYFYGMDKSGNVGWNVYDSVTGVVSRADVAVLSLTNTSTEQIVDGINEELAEQDEAESLQEKNERYLKIYQNRKWILIAVFALLILGVVLFNVRAWRRKKDREGDIFGDDYDDGYDESADAGEYEEEEYEDGEYEDEEYYEGDEEYYEEGAEGEEYYEDGDAGYVDQGTLNPQFAGQEIAGQGFADTYTPQAPESALQKYGKPAEEPLPQIDISDIQIAMPEEVNEQQTAGGMAGNDADADLEDQMIASMQSVLAGEVEQVQREQGVTGQKFGSGSSGFNPDDIEPQIIDFNDL